MATETDEYGKGCEENFVVDSGSAIIDHASAFSFDLDPLLSSQATFPSRRKWLSSCNASRATTRSNGSISREWTSTVSVEPVLSCRNRRRRFTSRASPSLPSCPPSPLKVPPLYSVGPRLVLINHRESEEERDRLLESGWRVTVFRRYFGSSNGLGGDVGWGLPVTSERESERREEGGWARTAEEGDEEGFQRVGRKGTKHKVW